MDSLRRVTKHRLANCMGWSARWDPTTTPVVRDTLASTRGATRTQLFARKAMKMRVTITRRMAERDVRVATMTTVTTVWRNVIALQAVMIATTAALTPLCTTEGAAGAYEDTSTARRWKGWSNACVTHFCTWTNTYELCRIGGSCQWRACHTSCSVLVDSFGSTLYYDLSAVSTCNRSTQHYRIVINKACPKALILVLG